MASKYLSIVKGICWFSKQKILLRRGILKDNYFHVEVNFVLKPQKNLKWQKAVLFFFKSFTSLFAKKMEKIFYEVRI